jgi:hypothetical protein
MDSVSHQSRLQIGASGGAAGQYATYFRHVTSKPAGRLRPETDPEIKVA